MTNNIDWFFITDQIYQKKCTPLISNNLVNSTLFGDKNIIQAWAEKIGYPLADGDNLTRVAQYLSITQQDVTRAKSNYLQFLKQELFKVASANPNADQSFLSQIKREMRGLTFSQLATERLHLPDFKNDPDHPLSILAALDMPVFLTTSHHHFIEAALISVGKQPRTEVYSWREGLEDNLPPQFQTDLDYEPDIQTPLVYSNSQYEKGMRE